MENEKNYISKKIESVAKLIEKYQGFIADPEKFETKRMNEDILAGLDEEKKLLENILNPWIKVTDRMLLAEIDGEIPVYDGQTISAIIFGDTPHEEEVEGVVSYDSLVQAAIITYPSEGHNSYLPLNEVQIIQVDETNH